MIDRLFVLWSDPEKGRRHVVGHLERRGGAFRFWYDDDLSLAESRGFARLPAFPELRHEADAYEARYLFASFAERIPSRSRPDTAAMFEEWGVVHPDDQLEILARSGGVRATDRIELAEYRALDDDLSRPLEFRIAASKYVEGAELTAGEAVILERQPENEFDSCATIVVAHSGRRAGYVPKQHSALVARLLDAGTKIEGMTVRRLSLPDDAGKWVVRISRASDLQR